MSRYCHLESLALSLIMFIFHHTQPHHINCQLLIQPGIRILNPNISVILVSDPNQDDLNQYG